MKDNKIEKPETKVTKKRSFGRKRIFIDPMFESMKYDRFGTYEENKQDFYDTFKRVLTGECKDIFEAYDTRK